MKITMYLHSSKDSNYEVGQEAGLKGKALEKFAYCLYEVKFEVEVDEITGKYEILTVDGKKLKLE